MFLHIMYHLLYKTICFCILYFTLSYVAQHRFELWLTPCKGDVLNRYTIGLLSLF